MYDQYLVIYVSESFRLCWDEIAKVCTCNSGRVV